MKSDSSSKTKSQKTVLVVEDSPTQSETIRTALIGQGIKVVCAYDGPSGLKEALKITPDLIVMDVNMPGMDGFQVAKELKRNPESANIPIVMLTSQDTPESLMLGLGAGVIDYIPKDVFATNVLVETIRQMGLI